MILVFSLSDLLHSVGQTWGPSTSLQMTQFIPFYGWLIFHFIYIYLCMHHIFFILSSVDGHIWAIVNNAVTKAIETCSYQTVWRTWTYKNNCFPPEKLHFYEKTSVGYHHSPTQIQAQESYHPFVTWDFSVSDLWLIHKQGVCVWWWWWGVG